MNFSNDPDAMRSKFPIINHHLLFFFGGQMRILFIRFPQLYTNFQWIQVLYLLKIYQLRVFFEDWIYLLRIWDFSTPGHHLAGHMPFPHLKGFLWEWYRGRGPTGKFRQKGTWIHRQKYIMILGIVLYSRQPLGKNPAKSLKVKLSVGPTCKIPRSTQRSV